MDENRSHAKGSLKQAVALRYDTTAGDNAPVVVAKGKGFVADEILRLAREHDIPLRQDAALAQTLSTLDVGTAIPPELFRVVAEVLAFVYKMNEKASVSGKPLR